MGLNVTPPSRTEQSTLTVLIPRGTGHSACIKDRTRPAPHCGDRTVKKQELRSVMPGLPQTIIRVARLAALMTLLGGVAVAPGVGAKPAPPDGGSGGPVFQWKVRDGIVSNRDGIALQNNPDGSSWSTPLLGGLPLGPVQADLWVDFDGCADSASAAFTVDGFALPATKGSACKAATAVVEGQHKVTMTVGSDGSAVTTTALINVVHHVVLGIGDSFGSGEGIEPPRGWANANCRRSAGSPQARAAGALEDSSSHSTVTFIFLSCSGATVPGGLVGSQLEPPGKHEVPPQLIEARRLTRGLDVDQVLLSIGGNDIGFPDLVKSCAARYHCPLQEQSGGLNLHETTQKYLAALPDTYRLIAAEMMRLGVIDDPAKVLHTEYPWVGTEPARKSSRLSSPSGTLYCDGAIPFVLQNGARVDGIQDDEFAWATEVVQDGDPLISSTFGYRPGFNRDAPTRPSVVNLTVRHPGLNTIIRHSPAGFTPVRGAEALFDGHGYCAEKSRYIVTVADFGLKKIVSNASGPMHPNQLGQARWGSLLGAALLAEVNPTLPPPTVIVLAPTSPRAVTATSTRYGEADVSWTAPSDDGGGPVTSYEVTAKAQTTPASAPVSGTTSSKTLTMTGLTPGVSYTFSVVAVKAAGPSLPSPESAPVLINSTVPPPTTPPPLTDATQVDANDLHTCAVVTGGSIKCWGRNDVGQLGDGTTVNSATPVTVVGISDATQAGAGGFHTCAMVAGGSVKCWGLNAVGELGNGTTVNSVTPVTVVGISDATHVGVGGRDACAVVAGGSIKCWGRNDYGQLGDGSKIHSSVPVTVIGG